MKKFSLILTAMFINLTLFADYYMPPQWDNDSGFTHQSWDFGDDGEYGTETITDMSKLPLSSYPDGEPNYINPAGTPKLTDFTHTHPFMKGWQYDPDRILTDRIAMYGGTSGDTILTFEVSQYPAEPYYYRQLWVQAAVYARKDGVDPVLFEVARDPAFTNTSGIKIISEQIHDPCEPEGYSADWYVVSKVFEISDPGTTDYIRVTAFHDPELPDPQRLGSSMIDQVDIDTRMLHNTDMNKTGETNYNDFAFFSKGWQQSGPAADFNNDGIVDETDLKLLAKKYLD